MKCKRNQIGALTLAIVAALFFALPLRAQVTIGAQSAPNPSAVLDLQSNDKYGLLLPKLLLGSTTDMTVLAGGVAVEGMLVYNTNTTTTGTNDVAPGVYYNDGTQWVATSGGQAAPATTFKVLEVSDNATVPNDVGLVKVNVTAPGKTLTLPTGDNAPSVGKIIYIINYSRDNSIQILPTPANNYISDIGNVASATFIYVGDDQWEAVSGY